MNDNKLCMLMILDGWGINPHRQGNAVSLAGTPNLNKLMAEYPHTRLRCHGEAVGLPDGTMGNSEVGHLNIGSGRIVYQDLVKINRSIENGEFFDNAALNSVMSDVNTAGAALHLMGLVSDGGVHSHIEHIYALLKLSKKRKIDRVYVHVILDGRDTPPDSGAGFVAHLNDAINKTGVGKIATICGRYYAMDRDKRWDRTEKAYRLYIGGEGLRETDPVAAVKNAYLRDETDEFVKPVVITDENEHPVARFENGDGMIFFNFRADRARQITRVFTDPDFDAFQRNALPKLSQFVCMKKYDESFTLPVAFSSEHMDKILGEVISGQGLSQLRIAETEKYAHVTYFFNGGEEEPFPLEDRILIPSPRDIPTYDHRPEMSALQVTEDVIKQIKTETYRFIVLNFANMDMVGHTGVLEAAIEACRTIDGCVQQIVSAVRKQNGVVMITADHGNAEMMIDENGHVHTAHTLNPVPFILVDDTRKKVRLKPGILADIAPTILEVMNIDKPDPMTGSSLIIP